MDFVIGTICCLVMLVVWASFSKVSEDSSNSKSYSSSSGSSTSSSESVNVDLLAEKISSACEILNKAYAEEGMPFAGVAFDMELMEKYYCQDPYGCKKDFIGKTLFFYDQLIDIKYDSDDYPHIVIGSGYKVGINSSPKEITNKADIYLNSEKLDQYMSTIKIGDMVGVMARLTNVDDFGFEMDCGIVIVRNNYIHPLTNILLKGLSKN